MVGRKFLLAASTVPSRPNSTTAWARSIAATLPWCSALRFFASVMSLANFTTRQGRPFSSRIGL